MKFERLSNPVYSFFTSASGGLAALCLLLAITANTALAAPTPSIVVGIAPLKYMVSALAGDQVRVSVVIPAGSDPHTFEPTAIQMGIIGEADVYLASGQPFEEVLLPRLSSSAPNMKIVDISREVEFLPPPDEIHIRIDPPSEPPANATAMGGVHDLEDEEADEPFEETVSEHDDDGRPDPHIWLSPANMKLLAQATLEELILLLPEQADAFQANYRQFIANVDQLDATIREKFASLPADQRAFLTFHPSWAYFARDYNLTQIAVEMHGYEPSPQLFAKIIDAAKERRVRTILLEQQFATSLVRTLAEELQARVVAISTLTMAWPDNLLTLADILSNPPEVPEGFYDEKE